MAGHWYYEVWVNILFSAQQRWELNGPTKNFLPEFMADLRRYSFLSFWDLFNVLNTAVAFTLLRYILLYVLFQPLGRYLQFIPKDLKKFPESAWKFLYYLSMFSYSAYTLFKGTYTFYENPESCWIGWRRGIPVPRDIYILYIIQGGFYIHSIFATLCMDKWRKDSHMMILHHILADCLILFSLAIRYHNIGLLVLFLHDVSDIILEFTKILSYMKMRGGKFHQSMDHAVGVGFVLLSFSWFYCRLYLFPHKVLHSTGHLGLAYIPTAPFYFFFNGLLWMLFFMHVWWFHFVVVLCWKIVSGKIRSVEDVRESNDDEELDGTDAVTEEDESKEADDSNKEKYQENHLKNGYVSNGDIMNHNHKELQEKTHTNGFYKPLDSEENEIDHNTQETTLRRRDK